MAYFSRLIALVFFALAFLPGQASATVQPVVKYTCNDSDTGLNATGTTGPGSCEALRSVYSTWTFSNWSCGAPSTSGYCSGTRTRAELSYSISFFWYVDGTQCPANSTASGGTCVCSTGYTELNGTCQQAPPTCNVNQELDTETNTCVCKTGGAGSFAVSGDVLYGCNDGCSMVLNSGSYSSSTNKTYGYWRQNGNTCSPAPDAPAVDSPDSSSGQDAGKCPTGQCPGTINGTSVCVPCKAKEVTESSSSENTTETPSGASSPSGSSSSSSTGSKSTECEGGVCVTKETITVTNPDGSTTDKEKETSESIGDYCAKNPNAAICKASEEGKWGGSCDGGFQCTGDPVQCAQAQASWKSACAGDVSGMTEQINTGTAAMAAGAASGLDIPGASDAFDLGSRLSDVPLFGSSGGCPSDVSVNVGGTSYTIAFSAMCPQLQVLGVALMAFAYLVAGFIVFRGDRS